MEGVPFNYEIEKELLAIMLNHPRTIPTVKKSITHGMFYSEDNQALFKGLLHCFHYNESTIDPLKLTEILKEQRPVDQAGAYSLVVELIQGGMTDTNLEFYIKKVIEYAGRRKLIRMSQMTQKLSNDMSVDIHDIVYKLNSGINLIQNATKEEADLRDDIEDMAANIGNKDATIPFGIRVLDTKISGFMRNDITTLGGRTSHGKTTFAIDTIKRQLNLDYSAVVVTNEVTKRLYLQKLACNLADIEYQKVIKFGEVTEEEHDKFKKAKKYMLDKYVGKLHMFEYVDNINSITALIAAHKPDVFWLDWLQRIPLVPGETDERKWIKIAYGELAKTVAQTNTSAVVVSQLSTRKAQARSSKRPELFDFDDSSFIEKASCDCHLLYWNYNDTMEKDYQSIVELSNAKNRFGEPSISFLSFNPKSGRYMDTTVIPRDKLSDYLKETGLWANDGN